MFQSLDIFRTADALARHAGAETGAIARNIANADTPGYRATGLPPFAEVYHDQMDSGLRRSRASHLRAFEDRELARPLGGEASPNGNDVSIEEQMFRAADAERNHTRAIAIYRHGLTLLRTSLGR